jgi:hypothetical protein
MNGVTRRSDALGRRRWPEDAKKVLALIDFSANRSIYLA